MEKQLLPTQEEMFGKMPVGKFQPCATYNRDLDWLVWLDEDVGYVAHPVHPGFEVLMHPYENRVVGYKIVGARRLFEKSGMKIVDQQPNYIISK